MKKFKHFINENKSKNIRASFTETNLKELIENGETVTSNITFILNGEPGYNQVGVSDDNLNDITEGKIAKSKGSYGLSVEFILQDIGYDRVLNIMSKRKR